MSGADRFRDATEIRVARDEVGDCLSELEEEFVVTVVDEDGGLVRVIGSPVVIADVRTWLLERDVTLE